MKLTFQYAHHSHNESEEKIISSPNKALEAFDTFEWLDEVLRANEFQKVSPTLTLTLDGKEHMIWVSAYGDESELQFVSECHFPGQVSGFLGLGKKQGIVKLGASSFKMSQAREAISLFIKNSEIELRSLYKNA